MKNEDNEARPHLAPIPQPQRRSCPPRRYDMQWRRDILVFPALVSLLPFFCLSPLRALGRQTGLFLAKKQGTNTTARKVVSSGTQYHSVATLRAMGVAGVIYRDSSIPRWYCAHRDGPAHSREAQLCAQKQQRFPPSSTTRSTSNYIHYCTVLSAVARLLLRLALASPRFLESGPHPLFVSHMRPDGSPKPVSSFFPVLFVSAHPQV
jgi:hypothetical protein